MNRQTVQILSLALLAAVPMLVGCSSSANDKYIGVVGTGGTISVNSGGAGGAATDAAQPDVLSSSDIPTHGDANPLGTMDVGIDVPLADAARPDVLSSSDTATHGDANPLDTMDAGMDGVPTDAAQPDVLPSSDRPIQDDTSPLATQDARTDSADTSSIGDSATDGLASENPQAIPSHQNVIFRVTNSTAAARYVGTDGYYCAAYAIDQGSTNMTMAIGYQCGCECPQPPNPALFRYLVISPQQTKDLVWDARALRTYSTLEDCSNWGPFAPPAAVTNGVWQPVGPGSYRVTLTLESVLPQGCTETDEVVFCSFPSYGGGMGGGGGGICPSSATVQASFDLPENGDVVVPITL